MKFRELIEPYEWGDIRDTMFILYPGQTRNERGYEVAFFELRYAATYIDNDATIDIELVEEEDDSYHDVYQLGSDGTRYGLDFVDWREVLGMNIDGEILGFYNQPDIIAHILFEITFYGYSNQDIQAKRTKIFDDVDEIKKSISEEDIEDWEEVLAKIDEEDGDSLLTINIEIT